MVGTRSTASLLLGDKDPLERLPASMRPPSANSFGNSLYGPGRP